jgi:hypothetical protein
VAVELNVVCHLFQMKKTFLQRLGATALFWGLPAMCLELIGAPRQYWGWILLFALPATVVGVFIYTIIELGIVRYVQREKGDRPASPDPR